MSTLVVADPRGVYLAGLEWVLREAGHSIVAVCRSRADVLPHVERNRPDIVIVSGNIADQELADLSLQLRVGGSGPRIIFIIQAHSGINVAKLQELEADGLLLDGVSNGCLVECVSAVEGGRKWIDSNILEHLLMPESLNGCAHRLTGRETEVAQLVSRGLRNKTIAQELHVSEGTVKMHLHHVYEKLHLGSRTELAWAELGNGDERLGHVTAARVDLYFRPLPKP